MTRWTVLLAGINIGLNGAALIIGKGTPTLHGFLMGVFIVVGIIGCCRAEALKG